MLIEMKIDELAASREAFLEVLHIARDHSSIEDVEHYEREIAANNREIVELFHQRSIASALMARGGQAV